MSVQPSCGAEVGIILFPLLFSSSFIVYRISDLFLQLGIALGQISSNQTVRMDNRMDRNRVIFLVTSL